MLKGTTAPRRLTVVSLGALALLAALRPASAADRPDPNVHKIEKLQKEIDKRDALIRNLLRRVEKLEHEEAAQSAARKSPPTRTAGRPTRPAKTANPAIPRPKLPANAPEAGQPDGPAPTQEAAQPAAPPSQGAAAANGPGQFTVSPEAAQHALERALVQTGAGLLLPWKAEFVPSMTYQMNQALRPDSLALTTTGNVLVSASSIRATTVQAAGLFRLGLPWDSQFEFSFPYAYKSFSNTTEILGTGINQDLSDANGIGDPAFALTKQVMQEGEWTPNLFLSGLVEPNLGMTHNGIPLGQGFDEFKVGIVATKRQDPLVFTTGFTYQTALENKGIEPGDQYTPSAGLLFAVSPQTSLQLSQQVTFIRRTQRFGHAIPGSDQVQGIFNVGLLSILGSKFVVDLNAGVGETPDAPNLTLMLSFPIKLN